jgi:hypothetical protein
MKVRLLRLRFRGPPLVQRCARPLEAMAVSATALVVSCGNRREVQFLVRLGDGEQCVLTRVDGRIHGSGDG